MAPFNGNRFHLSIIVAHTVLCSYERFDSCISQKLVACLLWEWFSAERETFRDTRIIKYNKNARVKDLMKETSVFRAQISPIRKEPLRSKAVSES